LVPIITLPKVLLLRASLISLLEKKYSELAQTGNIPLLFIRGIGGIGKTVLGNIYAQGHKVDLIAIIDAQSENRCFDSFVRLAEKLIRNEEDKKQCNEIIEEKSLEKAINLLKKFLQFRVREYKKWFFIFDDLQSNNVLEKYCPSIDWGNGKILITTQSQIIRPNSAFVSVPPLEEDESFQLFHMICKSINSEVKRDEAKDKIFLQSLPPFPLDVSIAAYYISETSISNKEYLERLDKNSVNFRNLIKEVAKESESTGYDKTRYSIISTSIQHILDLYPKLEGLLFFTSLFHHQYIPCTLLVKCLERLTLESDFLDNFIIEMRKYSLLLPQLNQEKNEEERYIDYHQSTQTNMFTYLCESVSSSIKSQLLQSFTHTLENYMLEVIDKRNIAKMKLLIKHIPVFLKHGEFLNGFSQEYSLQSASVLKLHATNYRYLGDYEKSEEALKSALKIEEKYKAYKETVTTLDSLGNIYRIIGNYKKAIELQSMALPRSEKYYGKNHEITAAILENLGSSHRYLGDSKEAMKLHKKSLKIYEGQYGSDHHKTGAAMNKLGMILDDLGNHFEAEKLMIKALTVAENYYGTEHIESGFPLNNLGIIYGNLGDYHKAKNLLSKAIKIFEDHYGHEHLLPAISANHLGVIYGNLGQTIEAKDLYIKSLKIFQKYFDENHIQILKLLINYSIILGHLGDLKQSKELLENVLIRLEKHYIKRYELIAIAQANLGDLYRAIGEVQKSKELLKKALHNMKQATTSKNVNIAKIMGNLALLYGCMQHKDKKRKILENSQAIFKEHMYPQHYAIKKTLIELGELENESINHKNIESTTLLGYPLTTVY